MQKKINRVGQTKFKFIVIFLSTVCTFIALFAERFEENLEVVSEENMNRIYFDTGQILNIEKILDPITSIPVKRYYIDGANIHEGYVNNSMYINDDDFFFLSDCNGSENIYRINLKSESIEKITDEIDKDTYKDVNSFGLTPCVMDSKLYYAVDNRIYNYDVVSKSSEMILELGVGEKLWAPLYVSNDGEWMSTTITKDDICYITRINLITKEIEYLKSPFVGTDNPTANHAYINPDNSNLIMFAHEGSWVMDRVWFWKTDTGEVYNLFQQPDYTEMGHEIWTNDAKYILIVQYGSPTRGIHSGFNFVDSNGNYIDQIISDEFWFNHVAISPDGQYIVSDTFRRDENNKLWIVLYSISEKKFFKIASYESDNHPAHAHPFFSMSGNKILFNNIVNGKIELNEINLHDIIGK